MAKGLQLVAFRLGKEIFGVQIEFIREIMLYILIVGLNFILLFGKHFQ